MSKTHGVVIIHGQGTAQYSGATLAQFLNSTIPSLEAGGYAVDRQIELKAQPPRASLTLQRRRLPDPEPDFAAGPLEGDRIIIREAFWDDAFPPPSADDVTRWALVGLRQRAGGMLSGWFRNPSTQRRSFFNLRDVGARIQIVLLVIALGAGLLITTVIQPVAWLLLTASRMPGLSAFGLTRRVGDAIRSLNPFLQFTLGDSVRLVTDRAWAETVRARLEAPVLELLGRGDVGHITIISYSAGAMVAYDALLTDRPIPRRAVAQRTPVRLVTLGSSINHLWNFAAMTDNGVRERDELASTPLDPCLIELAATGSGPEHAFWTDLFARFDYVPAGAAEVKITDRSGLDRGTSFRGHRVINYDHLVDDHGGYFHNREQVISRVLPLVLGQSNWVSQDKRVAMPAGAQLDDDRRTVSVAWLTAAELLPLYVFALHTLLYLSDPFGWRALVQRAGSELRGFPGISAASDLLARSLAVDPRHAAVLLVGGTVAFLVARSLYSWWLPKVNDEGLSWSRGSGRLRELLVAPFRSAGRMLTTSTLLALMIAVLLWAAGLPRAPALLLGLLGGVVVAIALVRWAGGGFERGGWDPRQGAFWAPVLALGLLTAAVAFLWIPARIEEGAFDVSLSPKGNNVEVLWADAGTVLLSGDDASKHGLLGLRWEDGRTLVGPVITTRDDEALRCVLPDDDGLVARPAVGGARVESEAYFVVGDVADPDAPPSTRGIVLREVAFDAPSGRRLAYVAGDRDGEDWVVIVHGKGTTREEGMRVVPALRALGLTVMAISYENDPESILGREVDYDYGRREWKDVAAAVAYARGEGARRIVLYGYSMGGGAVAKYLIEQPGDELAAIVLDAPMLDLGATIEHGIAGTPLLGWFAKPLTWAAEQRLRRDFGSASYVDGLVELTMQRELPVLILHQRDDHIVPLETSRDAAEGSTRISLVEFEDAGHTRAWNDDPERYERELTGFLSRELGLEQGPLVSTTTQAVLDAPCGTSTVGQVIDGTPALPTR